MRFLSLSVKNFMSFREFEYIFPGSGLIFVGGEVVDGSISSSNGAGKSSIFEALCWGLYGQTIRNVSKDAVVNRTAGRDCMVEVIFEDDHGEIYAIRRFRNDAKFMNSLLFYKGDHDVTGAAAQVTQELINTVLRMPWIVFSTAVVFGEKAARFAEARDSEKKQIFDEILMLQQYQEAQARVRTDLKALRTKIGETETKKLVVAERVSVNTSTLSNLEKENEDLKQRQESINQEVAEKNSELDGLRTAHEKMIEDVKQAKAAYESLDKENKTLYTSIQTLEKEKSIALKDVNSRLMGHQVERATISRRMSELKTKSEQDRTRLVGTRCPTCAQAITVDSIAEIHQHFLEELGEVEKEFSKADSSVRVDSEIVEKITKDFAQKQDEIFKTKKEMDEQLQILNKIFRDKDQEQMRKWSEIQLLQAQIKSLESSLKDRWERLLKQIEEIIRSLEEDKAQIAMIDQALKQLDLEKAYLTFWEEGFGNTGIKSLLLDEIIPQLNTRVAFYANVLMDDELLIQFDTESLLKSEKLKDKFDVGLFRNSTRVEYASCSSGEKRRVDVAILLALQSLVFERGACSSNLIILDEVFDSLDTTGVERVVALLSEEAKDKVIFVVSHMAEFRDYFNTELLVKKSGDRSYLSGGTI